MLVFCSECGQWILLGSLYAVCHEMRGYRRCGLRGYRQRPARISSTTREDIVNGLRGYRHKMAAWFLKLSFDVEYVTYAQKMSLIYAFFCQIVWWFKNNA